ncbi:homeobox-DDT domain protein RLT3-like isoform X2 [Durio zibethinus]|nr:homeobox-DDT domain protein RLT3-like isoform X2 [Durio zibethinus]
MEGYAAALGLTLKQVKGWFVENRRRGKRDNGIMLPIHSMKKLAAPKEGNATGISAARNSPKEQDLLVHSRSTSGDVLCSRYKSTSLVSENRFGKKKKKMLLPQDLFSPQYILKKVFRKDGPPLGVEFDSLPSQAFCHCQGSKDSHPADQECQRGATKRRKVPELTTIDYQNNGNRSAPVKKHGIGKGLMTVWRVVNPEGGDLPTGVGFSNSQIVAPPQTSSLAVRRQPPRNKRRPPLVSLMKQRRLEKKLQGKRRPSIKRREVQSNKDDNHRQPSKEKCELALEGSISNECLDLLAMLVDDEELELRELQAGTNPLTCSDHLGTRGVLGCSLCKDLLAKFPPNSVKMKQPFSMQPWDSSPETVKKLFKVFHFLYTYSVTLDICLFTLDEFAQAFHDKDSLLLGKIHVALLKLLLSDVEAELSAALSRRFSLPCKFLALLHSVENQEFVVEFWKTSLNPLTWTEILRQVLIAAGFGSTQGLLRREALSKEMSLMARYALCPGSLKGVLFKILSERGNNGLKVSDLASSLPVTELNLTSTTEELKELICSTLSSDITLFEKISSSAYRLRSSVAKDGSNCHSDNEDSGSIDDDSDDSSDDSEYDLGDYYQRKLKHKNHYRSKNNMLTVYTEIDESHQGEVWLLGLMEGEYSDLSIEEKLNALVALIDLLSSGSSIRMENPGKAVAVRVANIPQYGSGAKIKGSSSNQQNFPRPSWVYGGQRNGVQEAHTSSDSHPVDSSSITKFFEKEKCSGSRKDAKETEVGVDIHPIQSVFLGSDRRYNRYWLFLGPCNAYDPGHRRVYFESSEDGHWEVIDTEEALRTLLAVLDDRGKREALLIESLEKREASLYQQMSSRHLFDAGIRFMPSDSSEMDVGREDSLSPVSDVDNLSLTVAMNESLTSSGAIVLEAGKKGEEQNRKWRRLQEFDVWIWDCFYLNLNAVKHSKCSYLDSLTRCESCHDLYWRDEKHCRICHATFELDFDLEERYAIHVATCREKGDNSMLPKFKVLPSQLQSLKAAVHAIESVMPEDALIGAWTKSAHRLWVKRLRRTSSLSELLQVVADFVAAINKNWLNHCHIEQGGCTAIEEIIAFFPTMPETSSAVALWLVKLDQFIAPYLKKVHSEKELENQTRCSDTRAPKE